MNRGPGGTRARIPSQCPTLRASITSTWVIGRPYLRTQRDWLRAVPSRPSSVSQRAKLSGSAMWDAPRSRCTCRASEPWNSLGAVVSRPRVHPVRRAARFRIRASTRCRLRHRIFLAKAITGTTGGTTRIQSRASATRRRGSLEGSSIERHRRRPCGRTARSARGGSHLARLWGAVVAVRLD